MVVFTPLAIPCSRSIYKVLPGEVQHDPSQVAVQIAHPSALIGHFATAAHKNMRCMAQQHVMTGANIACLRSCILPLGLPLPSASAGGANRSLPLGSDSLCPPLQGS